MGRGEARWLSEERGNEQITGCFGPLTRASSCCPEQSCRPAGSSVSPSPHPPTPMSLYWSGCFSATGEQNSTQNRLNKKKTVGLPN